MTKFVAYYHLRPIYDTKDLIGISEDKDSANVIVTIGRNVISITNIATQKEICSWTVLDKLSTKVVYDKASEKYIGIFGDTYLRCWDSDTTNLNKIKKLKFNRKILDVMSSFGEEVLVLYSDGFCETLSSAIENRKYSKTTQLDLPLAMEVTQNKLFTLPNSVCKLLTYFLKKGQEVELVTVLLDAELKAMRDPISYKLIRHDKNLNLVGYTIVENQISPCLLTIWSDKRIFMLPLDENASPKDSPGNVLLMLDILNTAQPLSIIGLSKNCVVIYGANLCQEGASLILLNTQYKVVKAKQFFKMYFNFSKLWVIHNYILLAIGQNLSVITFNISEELLCDMIGSQFSNENQYIEVEELINDVSEECLEANIIFKTIKKQGKISKIDNDANSDDENIILPFSNSRKMPISSFETFNKEYKKLYSQSVLVNVYTDTNSDEMFNLSLMPDCNSEIFLHKELENIATNLNKLGASEQEISEKLIILTLKANLVDDMAIILRRYSNIYERVLVKVLKFALSGTKLGDYETDELLNLEHVENKYLMELPHSNHFSSFDISLHKPKVRPVSKHIELLNIVLSSSFDINLFSKYIKKNIVLDEVLILMHHLYNLIKSKRVSLEERKESSSEFDNDLHILKWVGLILNTHFQKLSFSRDVYVIKMMLKWNEIILQYIKDARELQSIRSILYNLTERKIIIHESKYSKWYNVEKIKLF